MDEGSFKPLDSTEGLVMDKGSFKPLAGVSKPKTGMEEAGDIAAAALTGAKSYPGFKTASASVGTALRKPLDILKAVLMPDWAKSQQEAKTNVESEFADRYSKQTDIIEGIEKNAPMTSAGADIAMQVPLYLSGEGALTKLFPALKYAAGAGKLNNIASTVGRGGIVNTGVQQALNPDSDRISKDFALGGAGELVGAGAGKLAEKVAPSAKAMGSRLYDSLFKRGTKTLEHELASEGGETLGKEMYDRGAWGKLKTLQGEAKAASSKTGGELDELIATKADTTIDNNTRIQELQKLKSKMMGVPSLEGQLSKIDDMILELKDRPSFTSLPEAQAAKKNIYARDEASYLKDVNPISKEVDMAEARALKESVEEPFIGEDGTNPVRDMNKELSYQTRLKDALSKKEAEVQGKSPIPRGADISKPIDAIMRLFGLDSVAATTATAQGIKQGGRGLEGLLKGTSKAAKLAPLAVGAESRMPEPESKYDIPIEAAGNVAESRPSFRAQPGIDPSSLSPELAQELQAIIEQTGVNPFLSSSGRTAKHNAEVGGVANSKHIFNNGLSDAADFSLKNLSRADLAKFMQAARSNPKLKALIHDAGSGMHIHTERR